MSSSLQCIFNRTGKAVLRPLGSALHEQRPNEVVHFDVLYMGSISASGWYILIIRDDLSSFVSLWPTAEALSSAVADAITTWIATYVLMAWFVSDQESNLKNEQFRVLTHDLKISHHSTTAYSPWANGTV